MRVLRADREFRPLPLVEGPGEARAIVHPGVGAQHRSMHYLALAPGARTVAQQHPASEAVYYVVRGEGAVEDLDAGAAHPVGAGQVVLITPASRYRLRAAAGSEIVLVGGPCPPDPALYEATR